MLKQLGLNPNCYVPPSFRLCSLEYPIVCWGVIKGIPL
jgi:hypothetical protein